MLSVSLNGAWRKEGIVLQNQREGYVPGANLEGERIYSLPRAATAREASNARDSGRGVGFAPAADPGSLPDAALRSL
jgi:hypothetical protein